MTWRRRTGEHSIRKPSRDGDSLRVISCTHPAATQVPLRVVIAGGGPAGLVLALVLKDYMGHAVHPVVYDCRWRNSNGRMHFRGENEGNRRRQQVTTLQSKVWRSLPVFVQQRLFVAGSFTEMWPYGPDSPESHGRPRNVRISWVEDVLLDLAQEHGIELVAERFADQPVDAFDLLAICDGRHSPTRQRFADHFGATSTELYSLKGAQHVETVIGLEVETELPDSETVLLTVLQNRYLLNVLNGRGFLNMRLTPEEGLEAVAIRSHGVVQCLQQSLCPMQREGHRFHGPTHDAIARPSCHAGSFLCSQIREGLRFFGVPDSKVVGLTMFRLGMEHHPRFTAQIGKHTYAAVLGDAGLGLHFWPGRGMNGAFKSALSLAQCASSRWKGRGFRDADFTVHEGIMHMLQYREKSRAWRTMEMRDDTDTPRPIHERLRAGIVGPHDPAADMAELMARARRIRHRLAHRMDGVLDDEALERRLGLLSPETLKVFVETDPWITGEVGGEEVDVSAFYPPRSAQPATGHAGRAEHHVA